MQLYLPVRSTDCAEAPDAANAATRPIVKDSILMKITPLLHVVEFTPNRGRRPSVCRRVRRPRSQKIVMAGLVPAIHVFLQMITKNVDARDKPGHDGVLEPYPVASCRSRSCNTW